MKQQKVLGAILHLKGLNSEATRENLKELFDNHAKVRYVDYSKGEPEAYVRFAEENMAKEGLEKVLAAQNGELKHRGAKLEARILEGEEENEYWRQIVRRLADTRAGRSGGKKNNKRGGRNNYNNNKKRKHSDDDDDEANGQDENGHDDKKVKDE